MFALDSGAPGVRQPEATPERPHKNLKLTIMDVFLVQTVAKTDSDNELEPGDGDPARPKAKPNKKISTSPKNAQKVAINANMQS